MVNNQKLCTNSLIHDLDTHTTYCAWFQVSYGEFPISLSLSQSSSRGAGKSNIPLHGYGTDLATTHGLAVFNCIRENHAMYILLPNSNPLSVMYILV